MLGVELLHRRRVVRGELPVHGADLEALAHDRHRGPISLQEEERRVLALRLVEVLKPKDRIRRHSHYALAWYVHLPAHWVLLGSRRGRAPLPQNLTPRDKANPPMLPARRDEPHQDRRDHQCVLKEPMSNVPILGAPIALRTRYAEPSSQEISSRVA